MEQYIQMEHLESLSLEKIYKNFELRRYRFRGGVKKASR